MDLATHLQIKGLIKKEFNGSSEYATDINHYEDNHFQKYPIVTEQIYAVEVKVSESTKICNFDSYRESENILNNKPLNNKKETLENLENTTETNNAAEMDLKMKKGSVYKGKTILFLYRM